MIHKRRLIRGLLCCCPVVLLVTLALIQGQDNLICLKISLKTLRMAPCVRCACDQRGIRKHFLSFPRRKSIRCYRITQRGKLPDPLRFVAPQRFVTSSLVQTLTYIDNLLPASSPDAAALRPLLKAVRVLTLPYLEFEYFNVYRGTYGKTLPLIHRHPDVIVILWNKGDHDHVFFLTMSQLLPCLKDMQATNWSLIVFLE